MKRHATWLLPLLALALVCGCQHPDIDREARIRSLPDRYDPNQTAGANDGGITMAPDYHPDRPEDYNGSPDDRGGGGVTDHDLTRGDDTRLRGDGWQDPNDPLTPRDGGKVVVTERRWVPVYFAYDQSTIGAMERPKIEKLAGYLKEHPPYEVVIEGHCDERGSEEYNRALGERRALSVKDYLAELGVATSRMRTISYGEEKPLVRGDNEKSYQQNRRAEFVVIAPR